MLWKLCVFALLVVGCKAENAPEAFEGNLGQIPVQGSHNLESMGSEFGSKPAQFDDEDRPSMHLQDQTNIATQQVNNSVFEEPGEQNQKMPVNPEIFELGRMEQQAADSAFESVAPDNSRPYRSAQVISDTIDDGETAGLVDRTQDKVINLIADSVTLNDCVMRGEIRNFSDYEYARNVTVTVGSLDGDENVQWHWPMTMLPGESAPFEVQIDWFPHVYRIDNPTGDMQYALNIDHWDWFANTYFDVAAELSLDPDLKRAFELNSDETEFEVLWQNPGHKFLVYDERALELESSKDWHRYGSEWSVISTPSFASALSGEFVKSNDIEPVVSKFTLYQYADLFYVPSRLYPSIYQEGVHDTITDVKVYQAYKRGPEVIDLRELIPHSISEEVDGQGLLLDRRLTAKTDFVNYDISDDARTYLQLLKPHHYPEEFPARNVAGESSTHREPTSGPHVSYDIWIGGVNHSQVSSTEDVLVTLVDENSDSCYASGPLCVGDFTLQGQMALQLTHVLGRKGSCPSFESGTKPSDDISVDYESITLHNQEIRGLVYNSSRDDVARDVIVTANLGDSEIQLGEWRWPLSVQPTERVPFEISHHMSNLSIEDIQFRISASLSDNMDPSRSFLVETYASGRVYGSEFMDLYEDKPFASPYPAYYELRPSQILNHYAILAPPRIRYTKKEFLELYEGAIWLEDIEGVELFSFVDFYARLEPPDSHPELAKTATTQTIQNLRAYGAIFDPDSKVVDVKEVLLFTPVYGQANVSVPHIEVDSIPAPNRWSPNAVRLLLIIPYEDEIDMKEGYYSQVWIGGASKPVE